MSTELSTIERPFFTEEQQAMIRHKYAPRATKEEFQVLLEIARARGLNPITSQIYFIERGGKWSVQVGIDGLRALAERSGLYAGQDEPEFEEVDGRIKLCKVRVYRKDWGNRACVGVAYWEEYGARASNPLWKTLPHGMLAKVAEALALRKAFPEHTGGLYTRDEMDRDDRAEPPLQSSQPAVAALPPAPASEPRAVGSEGLFEALPGKVQALLNDGDFEAARDHARSIYFTLGAKEKAAVVAYFPPAQAKAHAEERGAA